MMGWPSPRGLRRVTLKSVGFTRGMIPQHGSIDVVLPEQAVLLIVPQLRKESVTGTTLGVQNSTQLCA